MEKVVLFLKPGKRRKKEIAPILSKAFSSAADFLALNADEKKRKEWKRSKFYDICANAERRILKNSNEIRYIVEWMDKKRSRIKRYEILAEIEDSKRIKLEWENQKITLKLLSSDEKRILAYFSMPQS